MWMGCGPLPTKVNQLDRASAHFCFISLALKRRAAATQRVFIVDTVLMISIKIVQNSKHYYLHVFPVSNCLLVTYLVVLGFRNQKVT